MLAPSRSTSSLAQALKEALARRDRAEANRIVGELLDRRAPLGEQWKGIAQLMRVSGEYGLAHRAIDAFILASGNTPRARYEKVVLLTQTGRLREAHDLLDSLPDTQADRANRAYILGNTALTLGLREKGRAELEQTVRLKPGWGPAWLSLSTAVNFATDPLGDLLLDQAAAAERQGPGDLARYCYALGKLHADRGDHAASFAAYARGARSLRAETPYSRQGNAANARAAMSGFPAGFIEEMNARVSIPTGRPIFVTGLPRSGTTLVEQILTSHSTVSDGGELNSIHQLAVTVGGVSGEAIARRLAGGGSVDHLAGLYLHLLDERFGTRGRVVDKTIDASRFLGLIACLLPDAPLVWMRRDPLDSAWSCFRTYFTHGVAWSYSLTDIAHHFRLEDELLAFWHERLGERLLVVPYGALVDEPEAWTRRLLAHCGLAEEAAPYAPHETERVVATASALQVRRPINRDGLGVAEPYRAFMEPFIEAYRGG